MLQGGEQRFPSGLTVVSNTAPQTKGPYLQLPGLGLDGDGETQPCPPETRPSVGGGSQKLPLVIALQRLCGIVSLTAGEGEGAQMPLSL